MHLNNTQNLCCINNSIKHGKSKSGIQRNYCKVCKKTWPSYYKYLAYKPNTNKKISSLIKEGVGIRSISRLLKISKNTVLKRIVSIAKKIKKPAIAFNSVYEVDELRTYIKMKTNLKWLVIAYDNILKKVVEFNIGRRTART